MNDVRSAEPVTFGLMARAVLKGFFLFGLFNLMYIGVKPFDNGLLPTVYNGFVSGRTRFSFAAGYEYNLERLLADHVIQTAQPDHYNIVVLGSSETWGLTSGPDETILAYLDDLELRAADGRPVKIYNLAFPRPDILKDLVIWEALRSDHLPVDLVILTVNSGAFSNGAFADDTEHRLLTENGPFVQAVLTHYGLSSSLLMEEPRSTQSVFWQEREDLAAWIRGQVHSVPWTVIHQDLSSIRTLIPLNAFGNGRTQTLPQITRDGVLGAFGQSSHESGIPLFVLGVPIASIENPFEAWIINHASESHLPLFNCLTVLDQPQLFGDGVHLMPEAHPLFADILAASLSNPLLRDIDEGLPLQGAADTQRTCDFYPVSS